VYDLVGPPTAILRPHSATPPLRMASIQVHNVALQQNPDRYTADFNFHIRFDALEDIPCVPHG